MSFRSQPLFFLISTAVVLVAAPAAAQDDHAARFYGGGFFPAENSGVVGGLIGADTAPLTEDFVLGFLYEAGLGQWPGSSNETPGLRFLGNVSALARVGMELGPLIPYFDFAAGAGWAGSWRPALSGDLGLGLAIKLSDSLQVDVGAKLRLMLFVFEPERDGLSLWMGTAGVRF